MAHYADVDALYVTCPMLKDVTDLTSAALCDSFIAGAEALIDGRLAKAYQVPVTPVPPLLRTLATDIAAYRVLSQRIFLAATPADSPWPNRFAESLKLLEDLADGKLALVDANGAVIAGSTSAPAATSSTERYNATFNEGSVARQHVDPGKLQALRDARSW
jgi:phage gp36-like protein